MTFFETLALVLIGLVFLIFFILLWAAIFGPSSTDESE